MARGKAQKKSSMRGKRGVQNSRAGDERDTGKKVAGETGGRAAASATREGQFEEGSERTRQMASRGGHASKGMRRPRKSDI